ncbi:hypothetical protein ACHAPE_002051 [Trichoderma viride]
MGLRDELRKKFSSGKKTSSSHDTGIQQDQATKLHAPTPPREHADSKHIKPKLPVQLNLVDAPIQELWNVAYEKLCQEDAKLIQDYEGKIQEDLTAGSGLILAPSINARERMELVLKSKMDKVKRDAWRLQFGDSEIQIAAILPIFASIASKANAYISTALTANPPASLAWGGISALLPLFLNPSEQAGSLAKGLDYISTLIVRGQLREGLYSRRYALEKMTDGCQSPSLDHLAYKRALEAQYRNILRFQAETYCHLAKNAAHRFGLDAVKWNDWEAMIDDVRSQEDALAALDNLWHDAQYSQDSLAVKKQHQESLAAWLTISEDVSSLRKAIAEAEKDRDRADLLLWLCQVDPSQMYNAARDKHEVGTSEWLMENQELLAWEKEDKSLLWIHAGSGKSILSSSVIKHLDDKCLSDPLSAVAYFYFSFTDPQKQGVDVMLASIIKQILACRPNIPQSALKLKEYKASGKRPDTQTLTTALTDAIFGFSAVYIVIDALDECPTLSGERKKLLKALGTILDKAPENLHLLFTSRKESDISAAMKHHLLRPCGHELDLLAYRSIIDDDIGIFIDTILASDDYESWPASVKEEARNSLIEKADGMFQYVRCQFDALNDLSTVAEVHEALQSLPDGLGATYDRMLLNINPKFQSRIIDSLKWLAFSLTPIEVDWLSEIFTYRAEHTHPPDGTENLFYASDIIKYFSSLVVVADDVVRLAHFSIKEYLISTQITGGPAAAFGLTEIDAHLHIATWCLAHHVLHADDGVYKRVKMEDRFRDNPDDLDSYTSMQWARHLEMVPSKLWPFEIVQKAVSALDARSKTLAKLISFDTWYSYRENLFLARPICYTTRMGLSNLTMMLLSNGPETNNFFTQEDLDSALANAAYKGNIDLVRQLLDKGANVQAEEEVVSDNTEHVMRKFNGSREHASPLHAAALGGHLEIAQLLVNKGAEINATHGAAGSALHAAARGGHLDIVRFLVDRGADIHARLDREGSVLASSIHLTNDQCFQFLLSKGALKKDDGETALIRAALVSRWDLCYLLLDQGASVHASAPCAMYESPLQAACILSVLEREGGDFTKRVNFVERLLDLGADINAPGSCYGTALQSACRNGDIRLVKMLLNKGADINVTDRLDQDALQYALSASRDKLDIIKLLLSNGANVNAQSLLGNPLHAACSMGCSKDEISLLLEHGVDIHAKNGDSISVLETAAAYGHEWLVRELLERGVDVNEGGSQHGTALQAAYRLYNSEQAQDIVKLLLEHDADVHAKGGVSGSALTAAAANLRLPNSSIQQLLDLGVDINDCEGIRGTTALQAVLENLTDDIEPTKLIERLQFLFERGADADAGAGLYGFALQSAVMANYRSVRIPLYRNVGLEFLFDHYPDINVNAEGGKYGSALQAAAYAGQPESVKLLIQKGANVNAQGGEYKNALNAATIWGFWDIVTILLDNGAEPDCYRSERPDEEWLCDMVEKCGRGARERYERVWEMKNPKLDVANQGL